MKSGDNDTDHIHHLLNIETVCSVISYPIASSNLHTTLLDDVVLSRSVVTDSLRPHGL